jgi:hypothetical protein
MTVRRVVAAALTALLTATALTACVPGDSSRVVVGGEGFVARIAGVTVSGPAGVAPEGTEVRLEAIDAPLPTDVTEFSAAVGTAISLTLDGGKLQPAEPLEVEFTVPESEDPVFVIGEDSSTGTGTAFVESEWDPERRVVTATVDHLSWFSPVAVDEEKFSDKVADWIEQSAGVNTARPECVGADEKLRFSSIPDNIVWPCAEERGGAVEWSLQSNSGLVWEVLTEPQADYEPLTALTLSGIATIELAKTVAAGLKGDTVLLPLETLKGSFELGEAPYTIALQVEPGLSQVTTLLFGLSMMFPSKWLDLISQAECLVDVVKTATSSPSGESWRTVWGCVASILTGAGGTLLSILMTGPGLFATQMDGLSRELSQTNAVQFTLGYSDPTQLDDKPSGASWLYELPQEIVADPAEEVAAPVPVGDSTVVFQHSSSVWVGCEGKAHKIIFYLDGDYTELSFGLGLQAHAPEGMTADIEIRAVAEEDSRFVLPENYSGEIGRWSITRGQPLERQTVDVTGVWSVSVSAITSTPCGSADIGYAALLDAYVR